MAIYYPSLPLEVVSLQGSRIVPSDRFCQCNCCPGGETDSWCFLLHHLPRIFSDPKPFAQQWVKQSGSEEGNFPGLLDTGAALTVVPKPVGEALTWRQLD